jgi:hypothetical protein
MEAQPSPKSTSRSMGTHCRWYHQTVYVGDLGDSHMAGDGSDVHNDPSPLFSHVWDDELRKPHWGEEIGFKRLAGNIQVHIQDWTCSK